MPRKIRESEVRPSYQLPPEMIIALAAGRKELLGPLIRELQSKSVPPKFNNFTVGEIVRLLGDLMDDLEIEKRKYNEFKDEFEMAMEDAGHLKQLSDHLELIAEKIERDWK